MQFRNEEGLTLIELLITLAVVAIVFAVAVPTFNGVLAQASADKDAANAAISARFSSDWAQAGYTVVDGKVVVDGSTLASL